MYTLARIAKLIDAQLIGDSKLKITSIAPLANAGSTHLTYAIGDKFKKDLTHSNAGAVIVDKTLLKYCPTNALVVDNVYLAFAVITHYFKYQNKHFSGIHPSANINNAKISNNCTIGEDVIIGKNSLIGPNCVIEDNVIIGESTYLYANVVILQGCSVGSNATIAPGVVIGYEGFGNAKDDSGGWHNIAHLGNVVIGNDVTIGANSVIDRGTIEDTEIHDGVCIDNLVHIAHNVIIGKNCALAAGVTIGGSTVLGERCMIGGGTTCANQLKLVDDVIVSGSSTIDKNINKAGRYTGFTSLAPHRQWKKTSIWLLKLDTIVAYLNIKLKDLKR